MGFWRVLYNTLGWDYPKDIWIEQQRWNKYELCQEIEKFKYVRPSDVKKKATIYGLNGERKNLKGSVNPCITILKLKEKK